MKTFRFLSIIIMSLLMTSAFAQQGQRQIRTPEETAKAQVEWMKTDLSLDQATQTKVYDVVLKYSRKQTEERQKAIQAGGGSDREAMRAKIIEITNERDKEFKVILGDQKFELFKKKETERRAAQQKRIQG